MSFDINVHAHRWAAKYLVPGWLARGEGYFCSTASAAGVLAQNVVRVAGAVLEPSEVADVVVRTIRDETFFILPHPEVAEFAKVKATEHERWLGGMRKLQKRVLGF